MSNFMDLNDAAGMYATLMTQRVAAVDARDDANRRVVGLQKMIDGLVEMFPELTKPAAATGHIELTGMGQTTLPEAESETEAEDEPEYEPPLRQILRGDDLMNVIVNLLNHNPTDGWFTVHGIQAGLADVVGGVPNDYPIHAVRRAARSAAERALIAVRDKDLRTKEYRSLIHEAYPALPDGPENSEGPTAGTVEPSVEVLPTEGGESHPTAAQTSRADHSPG